jgi:hypothetical protein
LQPNHPGNMIQFGQNAGQRNKRVFGLVRNLLCKNITPDECHAKDRRILGVFGLSWAIFQSALPKAVTDACETALEESGIPSMTHQDDKEGMQMFDLLNHITKCYISAGIYT